MRGGATGTVPVTLTARAAAHTSYTSHTAHHTRHWSLRTAAQRQHVDTSHSTHLAYDTPYTRSGDERQGLASNRERQLARSEDDRRMPDLGLAASRHPHNNPLAVNAERQTSTAAAQ